MKKITAILLALTMLLLFASCSDSGNNGAETTTAKAAETQPSADPVERKEAPSDVMTIDEFADFIATYVRISNYSEQRSEKTVYYNLKTECMPSYVNDAEIEMLNDYAVYIDGDFLGIGEESSDIIEDGWQLMDSENLTKDFGANTVSAPMILTKAGKEVTIYCENNEDTAVKYEQTFIKTIEVEPYIYDSDFKIMKNIGCPEFKIDRKIENESSLADIIDALGEPTQISYSINYDGKVAALGLRFDDNDGGLIINLSGDGKYIRTLRLDG